MTGSRVHRRPDSHRAFAAGVTLNTLFVLAEGGVGAAVGSLALIADAGHNFSDVISLLLAWGAGALAQRAATERRTYGFRKATVVASFISAVLLLAALGAIAREAVGRLLHPAPVGGPVIILVAAIGAVINAATAALFFSGKKNDLNIQAAFLHMAADAGVSLGVVVGGILIALKGWPWIDPAISLAIVVIVFWGTWKLFRRSLDLTLDAVPENIDIAGIKGYLAGLENVVQIHDLHVWALSTTEVALTVHVVAAADSFDTNTLCGIQRHLHDRFGIAHATIQVETPTAGDGCLLDRPDCL
ncbi:MAG: Cadmium, cobalt and zinc/H(+)-K(+) antiporter [Candidatus Aminicenantes bacterium ADurb.Bin147]|nr:cation diffusion facilitator family transporter [Acidobacteriota bacterium]OQB58596.1 MAG: Cadmium, cobalt and zinc/H(+)-K(+) antiporter [Candidatus Aminicenantes bacterium ADurb.Bin147]